jgi:hypothetical protein
MKKILLFLLAACAWAAPSQVTIAASNRGTVCRFLHQPYLLGVDEFPL